MGIVRNVPALPILKIRLLEDEASFMASNALGAEALAFVAACRGVR
jgi:hypothetical protein